MGLIVRASCLLQITLGMAVGIACPIMLGDFLIGRHDGPGYVPAGFADCEITTTNV